MKLRVFIFAAVLMASGCATNYGASDSYRAHTINTFLPLAEKGEMKWSDYYIRLHVAAISDHVPLEAPYMQRLNDLVERAREYEAGKLTREQFESYKRLTAAAESSDENSRKQQAARNDASSAAYLNAAAILLNNSGPRSLTAPQPQERIIGPTGFLKDQSVSGTLRYCRYSNGIVTTISAISLCPLSAN